MRLNHIVAAVDNSAASRDAARTAARLALQTGAELTLLAVAPGPRPAASGSSSVTPLDLVEQALGPELLSETPGLAVEVAGAYGLPQVEIGRFAENRKADLVVLGRKPRSRATRLFLGDTADAVVRRSRIPCMLVPPGFSRVSHMLVALDGSDRGFIVFDFASQLASHGTMTLSAVTVEPVWPGEPDLLAEGLLTGRSQRLSERIHEKLHSRKNGLSTALKTEMLQVRRGEPVEQIVATITEVGADILVLGFHRGGPAMAVEEGSVSRRLVHAAPCAVITVPF